MADKIDDLIGKIDSLTNNISNLVTVVAQNTASISTGGKASGNSRYSSGLPGYSFLFGNTKNLDKALKVIELTQRTNQQTSSLGSRIFENATHARRNLEAERLALEETTESYLKSKENLQKILNKTFKSDAEMFKFIKDMVESHKKTINELNTKYEEVANKKNHHRKKGEKLSADDISKMSEAELEANKVTKKDIKEILELREKNKEEQEKINDCEKESVDVITKGNQQLNQQMHLRQMSFRTMGDGLRDIKRGFTDIYNVGKQFANAWMKIDTASSNFARSIGMGSAGMAALRVNTIGRIANTNLSDLYGVGMEDLVKLQAGYTSAIGRNVGMSNLDQENAIAMNVVMGEKGGQLAASLENFGLSYSDAAKTAGKMFQDAGKYGLSFEKYSENFLQNIKIAQNYTFKNGLKGLESMAKKATAIRLDMQQVSAFAEKVGSLQGSVETAAQLQVLGGPFAQFSDPLGMLNESMTNMEGLMDRFQKMVGNLGKFNQATGQVEVTAFNKQRIRAAAQAMGMDYGQVMESVQAQGRRNYIGKALGSGWSDEEREFIMNTANVKGGKPMLSYIDVNGNRVEKDVSKTSQEELAIARQQNQSQTDDIKSIAVDTRNMAQQITGVQNKADAVRAKKFEAVHTTVSEGISTINKKLGVIIGLITAFGIGKGIVGIGGGIGQVIGGGRGLRGTGGGFGQNIFGKGSFGKATNTGLGGQTAGASTASRMGRNFIKPKGIGIGLAGELIGEIAGGAIKRANERNINSGKYKQDSKQDLNRQALGSTLQWAGRGAALGGLFGPIGAAIGAGVGALGGGIYGLVNRGNTLKKNEANTAIGKLGYSLSGDYNKKEMETILSAIKNGRGSTITEAEFSTFSKDLQEKIMKSGDAGLFPELKEIAVSTNNGTFDIQSATLTIQNGSIDRKVKRIEKADGGLLNGPSHKDGGMPILGSNVSVEGHEFIVNKNSTENNLGLLNAVNTLGRDRSIIKPRKAADGGLLTVTPSESIINHNQNSNYSNGGKQEISLNISGTIKLEGSGGKSVDITDEMLNDAMFIRKITKLIEKQMTINSKGGNVVTKGLYNS